MVDTGLEELLFIQWALIMFLVLAIFIVLQTRLRYGRGRRAYTNPYLFIYLAIAFIILFGTLIIFIEFFFSEPYVTYPVFLGGVGVVLGLMSGWFVHLTRRIDDLYLPRRRYPPRRRRRKK